MAIMRSNPDECDCGYLKMIVYYSLFRRVGTPMRQTSGQPPLRLLIYRSLLYDNLNRVVVPIWIP